MTRDPKGLLAVVRARIALLGPERPDEPPSVASQREAAKKRERELMDEIAGTVQTRLPYRGDGE